MQANKSVTFPLVLIIAINIVVSTSIRKGFANDHEHRKHAVDGEIVYSGLDALPWHSKVRVYIEDITAKGPQGVIAAEENILTVGQQIPIKFSIVIPEDAFRSKNTYSICADITIVDRLSFTCEQPYHFRGASKPRYLRIRLRRVM